MIVKSGKPSDGEQLVEVCSTQIPSPYVKIYTLEERGLVSLSRREKERGHCLHVKHDTTQYFLPRYIEHGSQRYHRCQHKVQPGCPLAGIINRIRERASDALEYKEEPHGNRQDNLASNQNPLAVHGSKQACVGVDECRQEKSREFR